MRRIAATILLLCICISSAQRTAGTKIVAGLLKRLEVDSCKGKPPFENTVCQGENRSMCCNTGSGDWKCCPDGSCCPTHNFTVGGAQWYCKGESGGCCYDVGSIPTCFGTTTSAAAVPSKAATPSSKAQSFKNVTVSATDPRITYTPQWNLGTSTCDASQQSKKTVTANQSLSFNTQGFSVGSGSAIYVDFSQKSASFQILINGQPAINDVGVLKNCTYNGPIMFSTAAEIKILIDGFTSKGSEGTTDSEGFFELNSFLVTEKSSASKATRSAGVRVIGALLLAVVLSV